MRHRKFTFKIGRTSSHRRAMMANAVSSLIAEGRIKTTVTRGKQIKRMADKMITLGKKGTLHTRRQAISKLQYNRHHESAQINVISVLFDELAPRYKDRNGGYTRLLRLGRRRGDAAEMCLVEFVTDDAVVTPTPTATTETDEKPVETVEVAETEETASPTKETAETAPVEE